jgi:hypothetical protein
MEAREFKSLVGARLVNLTQGVVDNNIIFVFKTPEGKLEGFNLYPGEKARAELCKFEDAALPVNVERTVPEKPKRTSKKSHHKKKETKEEKKVEVTQDNVDAVLQEAEEAQFPKEPKIN